MKHQLRGSKSHPLSVASVRGSLPSHTTNSGFPSDEALKRNLVSQRNRVSGLSHPPEQGYGVVPSVLLQFINNKATKRPAKNLTLFAIY